jgi:hypothetical protein
MNNTELLELYKQKEEEIIVTYIDIYGLECTITPIQHNNPEMNDYDPFNYDENNNLEVEVLNNFNQVKEKEVFADSYDSKIYIQNDPESLQPFLTQYDNQNTITPYSIEDDNNTTPFVYGYVENKNTTTLIEVGSLIQIKGYNYKYKVMKNYTPRGISLIQKLKLVKG